MKYPSSVFPDPRKYISVRALGRMFGGDSPSHIGILMRILVTPPPKATTPRNKGLIAGVSLNKAGY